MKFFGDVGSWLLVAVFELVGTAQAGDTKQVATGR